MKKYLLIIASLVLLTGVAHADNPLWKISSSTLQPVNSSWPVSSTEYCLNGTCVISWPNGGVTSTAGNWSGTWQGANSTTFYLATNPYGFTTTTIQAVLNSLSASGCLIYSTSTGQFGSTCITSSTGATLYYPLNSNPAGYVTSTGSGGEGTSTPFASPFLPLITSSSKLSNSNISQSTSTGYITASGTFTAIAPTDGLTYSAFRIAPTSSIGLVNDYTGSMGWSFQVLQRLTVTQLCRWYNASSTQNHNVYIWLGGAAASNATVLAASASDSQGFKCANVTPYILYPNNQYTISSDEVNGGDYFLSPSLQPWNSKFYFNQFIYRNGAAYINATGTYAPPQIAGSGIFSAPEFKFTLEATPQLVAAYGSATSGGYAIGPEGDATLVGQTADNAMNLPPLNNLNLSPTPTQSLPVLSVITGVFNPQIDHYGYLMAGDAGDLEYAPLTVYTSRQGPPSLSGITNDAFDICSTVTTCLAFGNDNSSPYEVWLQTHRVGNSGSSWPLALNPLGGNVGVNQSNPATALDVNGDITDEKAASHYGTGANTAIVCYTSTGKLGYITITSLLASGNCTAN